MASISKVIERVRAVKADALDEETKAGWLLSLEGRLHAEVIVPHAQPGEAVSEHPVVRSWPDDGDEELLVDAPYDDLYERYLIARIDHYYQDPDYAQSATLFNDALAEWRAWYNRKHRPVCSGGVQVM